MAALYDSLARANGRGSAGECPALHSAKTPFSFPAVGEPVCRVAAGVEACATTALALTHPAGASPRPSFKSDGHICSRFPGPWTVRNEQVWGFEVTRALGDYQSEWLRDKNGEEACFDTAKEAELAADQANIRSGVSA